MPNRCLYAFILSFLAGISTVIGALVIFFDKRKNNKRTPRNEEGLTQKQQELKELTEKILILKQNELSYRSIAEQLGITLGKVQRYLK